jgi:acyl-CoA-binding protein
MSDQEKFDKAQTDVKNLSKTPSNDELLKLYAFFKQATVGDVSGSRPGMLKVKDRAKYDAWSKVKGSGPDSAQSDYVTLVEGLISNYGLS